MPVPHGVRDFVMENLVLRGRCYFHCDQDTVFRELEAYGRIAGLYHCPGGYVSRVVYYDVEPDIRWFLSWVREIAAPLHVEERDVRVATRHQWEFGSGEPPKGGLEPYIIRQLYWTQPRPSEGREEGLYICAGTPEEAGCWRLFVQKHEAASPYCPECRFKEG
jgi:hypothetical protein